MLVASYPRSRNACAATSTSDASVYGSALVGRRPGRRPVSSRMALIPGLPS